MASEVITIPKEEYDRLVKCRHIVQSEFEEKYSEEFIRDIKESEEAYKKGDFVKFKSVKESKKFLDNA